MKKRILAVILAIAMLLPVFCIGSFAATPEEEAKQYLTETLGILSSGNFTIKARAASPFGGNNLLPITIVMDDNHFAFEATIDWAQHLRAEGYSNTGATLMGWGMQLLFGSKIRVITMPDQVLVILPNRRFYLSMLDVSDMQFEYSFDEIFAIAVVDVSQWLEGLDLTVTEPVIDGKKYLCATVKYEDITNNYYYLSGQLKRIVSQDLTWEIDELKAAADESLLSTKGMVKLPFDMPANLPLFRF